MSLPADVARCPGKGAEECENCRRREPGIGEWQVYMAAPEMVPCEARIEPPTSHR